MLEFGWIWHSDPAVQLLMHFLVEGSHCKPPLHWIWRPSSGSLIDPGALGATAFDVKLGSMNSQSSPSSASCVHLPSSSLQYKPSWQSVLRRQRLPSPTGWVQTPRLPSERHTKPS